MATALPNPFDGKEIWFLTGSQDLYGEETLAQVADQSQQVARWLDEAESIPVKIVWKPVLKDRDSIRTAMLEANADESCIGIIAWMHTFSPAKMWILGIDALAKPLLQLHTQYSAAMPWDTIDMDYMNLNQAAHGDREFGYILSRLGQPRKVVVGHATQPATQAKIGTWVRAAAGWDALHHTRLVRFGDNMRNVAVTEGDKTEAELRLGVSVNTWGVNDLVAVVDAVSEAEVDELIAEYQEAYEIVPELLPGGERHESLRYGARIEAGMRRFLQEHGAAAFTTNFEDLGGLRQLPGLAVQRLMAAGYGFGAEGDWKTAILVRAAKVMGYGLPGGASLMEDYCYEMREGKEKILGAHMLEVCPSLTESKPRLEIHPLGIGDREDPVRLVFDADRGPGIVVAMSDMRERFRLTANVVEVVGPDEPLPKLPVARAVWEPAPDFHTSTECWMMSGAAHHTVMSTATTLETWQDLAEIAQMELAVIDESTTTRSFTQNLRLNQVYYRLNQA
ncbi:MAG: L-arabinose isomerase [Actinomyces urogenitalis]|uniref:L-arabinose isomerase n=1 Tax=Actinomyces urogenitalis TaxID=103621 RepID=UPI001899CC2B|nr:L-arabinose isomerase [Actinomyces urogenitalis]MDU6151482.1 L-arabinose isomerase [Actinomyces urogenitalis]